MIHLDTSFLIRSLLPGTPESRALHAWLEASVPVAVSAVCWAEFLCGPLDGEALDLTRQIVGEPVPFGLEEAQLAARLFVSSGRRRGSMTDCMVAATVITAGASLATSDVKDFRRLVPLGLSLAQGPASG